TPTPVVGSVTAAGAPAHRGRILIVDDDPRIGEAVRESLLEHDVVALAGATGAPGRLSGGDRVDLNLCDLMMAGMSGVDLHEALTVAAPAQAARMIFLTGGAFTARARAFLADVPNARLDKPFDPSGLRRFVAISLENRGSGIERSSG